MGLATARRRRKTFSTRGKWDQRNSAICRCGGQNHSPTNRRTHSARPSDIALENRAGNPVVVPGKPAAGRQCAGLARWHAAEGPDWKHPIVLVEWVSRKQNNRSGEIGFNTL